MNLTDKSVGKFSTEELSELAHSVKIQKSISELDERLQIDLIRYRLLEAKIDSTPLIEKFKEVMKIGVEEEVFDLESFDIPPCYGCFAECNCLLHEECLEKLIDNLPPCYGILYNSTECQGCILKGTCQVEGFDDNGLDDANEVYMYRSKAAATNLLDALAYFAYLYGGLPQSLVVHHYNRAFNIKSISRLKRADTFLPIDSIMMTGEKKEKPTQRIPLVWNEERQPIYVKLSD